MNLILEINDNDFGLEIKKDAKFILRTAARAVLKKDDKIALLHVKKHNYYKLPGGGVGNGETIKEGLKREILEEVGCTFKILNEIGEILEHRSQINQVQISYCYLAEVEKDGKPEFTEEEVENGFKLVWVTLNNAIELIKKSRPNTYEGKFIVVRDLEFLKEARHFFK